jgi:plastocyanin
VSIHGDGQDLFEGEVVAGPTTVTYAVPALDPGEYAFVCDIHPEMTGTLVAG